MDERVSQFFLAVGRMCGDAGLGRLTVRLTLADGRVVTGVPDPLRETEGAAELDAIGYADAVTVGGAEVALSAVVEASVARPGLGTQPEGATPDDSVLSAPEQSGATPA